jgi:hypothetical protein
MWEMEQASNKPHKITDPLLNQAAGKTKEMQVRRIRRGNYSFTNSFTNMKLIL